MKLNWSNREERLRYHREKSKEWYEKNKEERRAQIKAYARTHTADAVRRTQKYRDKNKDAVYAYGRSYNKTVMGTYRSYKSHAKEKGNDFLLTPQEFAEIISNPCVYCGKDSLRIGIDRVDNAIGYKLENCAPCCKLCNYMKKHYSVEEFLSHIEKIYVHNCV